jgi:ATP-dependent DNA helicase DinG
MESIEVRVHQALKEILRQQSNIDPWTHHLTMARLVARAMRCEKSALLQTGLSPHLPAEKYRIGYLVPALLWQPVKIIVVLPEIKAQIVDRDLPQLQSWLGTHQPIYTGKSNPPTIGIWVLSLPEWLAGISAHEIPDRLPTIIDGLEELETWIDRTFTIDITPQSWLDLQIDRPPDIQTKIANIKIELAASLWQHPPNPYNYYELDRSELNLLTHTLDLCPKNLPPRWQEVRDRLDRPTPQFIGAKIDRQRGNFELSMRPLDIRPLLNSIWQDRPLVGIAGFIDLAADASSYRQQLLLADLTAVKFSPDRRSELCQLYLPRWMPLPNTPKFQPVLTAEIDRLLSSIPTPAPFFVAILVQDTPLRAQLAAILAARWGTRVKVETTSPNPTDILICGWDFWRDARSILPAPQLVIVATLPIPSLEDPAIAARVKIYKQNKQDWFRLFLLPIGLRTLHQAIAPLRRTQGTIAIFDNRIDRRSYGPQILAALSPIVRIDRPDWND